MGLAEALSDPMSQVHPNAGCFVGRLLASLPEGDAAALRDALSDPLWEGTAITRALNDDGHRVSSHTVNRHRKGGCQCEAAGLT